MLETLAALHLRRDGMDVRSLCKRMTNECDDVTEEEFPPTQTKKAEWRP